MTIETLFAQRSATLAALYAATETRKLQLQRELIRISTAINGVTGTHMDRGDMQLYKSRTINQRYGSQSSKGQVRFGGRSV